MSIINGNGDNGSPSREMLKKLFGALPGYAKQIQKKTAEKMALRATHATLPRKVCKICCKAFDLAFVPKETQVEPAICENCQTRLDAGETAFIEGLRYAFVVIPQGSKLDGMQGKVVKISTEAMNGIQEKKEGK